MAIVPRQDDTENDRLVDDGADHLRADILGSIVGSDPRLPNYLGRINNLITAHGAVGNDAATMMKSPRTAEGQPAMASPSPAMAVPGGDPGAPSRTPATPTATPDTSPPLMGSGKKQPSLLGKIGRVAARMGEIVAPGVAAWIPGTDINKRIEENRAEAKRERAEKESLEERRVGVEEAKEKRESEAVKTQTTDEQALAARQRILATPEGQAPDPKDVATWKAYADLEQAKQGAKPTDETKQPVGAAGVAQHAKQLDTLTAGMSPQERQRFLDAYNVQPTDTVQVATKNLEDAKGAAQLTGSERDRKLARDLAQQNRAEAQSEKRTEMGSEIVRAVDKNDKVSLLSRGEYEARQGEFKPNPMKVNEAALTKATDHATTINEMQGRANALSVAGQNMNWADKGQLNIVKQALNNVNHSYADSIIGIPITKFLADNLKQLGLEGATPETRRYIVSLLSLREAALGLPKEITGGSRVTDPSVNALWQTLPEGSTPNREWFREQLGAFQSTVDRLKQTRVPTVPGLPDVPKDPSLYQHHYVGKKGDIYSDDGKNWVDASGVPIGK